MKGHDSNMALSSLNLPFQPGISCRARLVQLCSQVLHAALHVPALQVELGVRDTMGCQKREGSSSVLTTDLLTSED